MLNQLVATGSAVPMQIQDGNAQGGAGGLSRSEFMDQVQLGGRNYSSYFTKLGEPWRKEPKLHSQAEVELNKF